MRSISRSIGLAALVIATGSCGDVVRQGRSPVYLVIATLQAAQGNHPTALGSNLLSDVLTIVTTGGVCSQANPCPTIFNDVGSVTLRLALKDIGTAANPTTPTTNNEVTITRYRVTYRRADGRNEPGVDVPFAFDGAATATVPSSGTLTMGFEIVRHVAKQESPLAQLVTNGSIITTLADVTLYGKDRVGNDISVTGTIQIDFGNFGDS